MPKCCIVIPVYKENPSDNEMISFKSFLFHLKDYHISILCPHIDLTVYINVLKAEKVDNYSIDYFDDGYFKNISGYNKLMMSKEFYKHYTQYEYILICQLDAYIFKNELAYWCDKDYDYIGAPWFTQRGSHEHGHTLWRVGNGGFSLRKVSTFLKILNRKLPFYSAKTIINKRNLFKKRFSFKDTALLFIYSLGYQNNLKYYIKHNIEPEDIFFIDIVTDSMIKFKVPTAEEGMKFAFERSPEYLYDLNNRELPFGCHAWEKYDIDFWKKFIQQIRI